jgi:hypothetical protein
VAVYRTLIRSLVTEKERRLELRSKAAFFSRLCVRPRTRLPCGVQHLRNPHGKRVVRWALRKALGDPLPSLFSERAAPTRRLPHVKRQAGRRRTKSLRVEHFCGARHRTLLTANALRPPQICWAQPPVRKNALKSLSTKILLGGRRTCFESRQFFFFVGNGCEVRYLPSPPEKDWAHSQLSPHQKRDVSTRKRKERYLESKRVLDGCRSYSRSVRA